MKKIGIIIGITLTLLYLTWPQEAHLKQYNTQLSSFEVIMDGYVVFPEKYTYYEPITLQEAIRRAGGLRVEADSSQLNMKQVINAQTTIYVPQKHIDTSLPLRIDLNHATYEMLLLVPYMTKNRAAAIILYRTEHKRFNSVLELMQVKYIKEATYEKISPYFFVE